MEDNLMSSLSNILNNRLPDSVITDNELERPFRNLIINGAMQVAQRGTSTASITTGGYYTADRWRFEVGSLGTWTMSVENDAPTGSGFRKSTKVLCTTADAAPAASDNLLIQQRLEGQNLQAIRKGTSSAQQLTLSFWVKSNVTGTYIADLYDNDNVRQVSAAYTIASSGTWEKKTIVFPADTTGAFDNDNALSLFAFFWLGAGTDFTSGTLNTSWASATNANRTVGQTNLAAATNNYWQITGVQLEVGAVATPFEFKPFAQDLAECQRYYQKSYTQTNNPGTISGVNKESTMSVNRTDRFAMDYSFNFILTMRAAPTVTVYSPGSGTSGNVRDEGAGADRAATAENIGDSRSSIRLNSGVTTTANAGHGWHWVASAEL
jgi:hypothetical protein